MDLTSLSVMLQGPFGAFCGPGYGIFRTLGPKILNAVRLHEIVSSFRDLRQRLRLLFLKEQCYTFLAIPKELLLQHKFAEFSEVVGLHIGTLYPAVKIASQPRQKLGAGLSVFWKCRSELFPKSFRGKSEAFKKLRLHLRVHNAVLLGHS